MTSATSIGRAMGALFLVQVALAPIIYFRWLPPGNRTAFLETAAGSASQVRTAILLAYGLSGITVGVALLAWPVFRRHSERLALAYFGLAIIGFCTLAMENVTLRQLLVMSEEFGKSAGSEALIAVGPVARATWRQAHFTNLMFAHAAMFLLHLILFRFALVPRILAALGMAVSVLSVVVVAGPLFGGTFNVASMTPTGVVQLALIGWLLARGLTEKPAAAPARMGNQ